MGLDVLVQQSKEQLLPQGLALPSFLNQVYKVFHWAHRNVHWVRWGRIISNPKNFPALLAGKMASKAIDIFGDPIGLKLIAQLILISNRILECVEAQIALTKECEKWKDAFWNNYPLATVHKWEARSVVSVISPSTSHKLYNFLFHGEHYLRHLCYRSAMLAKKIFFLSTATIEAIDALALNAEISSQAVNEVAYNGMKSIEIVAENRERLRKQLVKNKSVIDCILKTVKVSYHADQLINAIDKSMGKVESTHNMLQKVNDLAGATLKESAKYIGFGLMSAAGLAQAAPDWLVPTKGFSDVACSNQERFAPIYPRNESNPFWAKAAIPKKNKGMSLQEAYNAARNLKSV